MKGDVGAQGMPPPSVDDSLMSETSPIRQNPEATTSKRLGSCSPSVQSMTPNMPGRHSDFRTRQVQFKEARTQVETLPKSTASSSNAPSSDSWEWQDYGNWNWWWQDNANRDSDSWWSYKDQGYGRGWWNR